MLLKVMGKTSQRTLTMFVEVVTFRYQHPATLVTECHNSYTHSQGLFFTRVNQVTAQFSTIGVCQQKLSEYRADNFKSQ